MIDDAPSRRVWPNLTIEEFLDLVAVGAPSRGGWAVAAMSFATAGCEAAATLTARPSPGFHSGTQ